MQGELLIQNRGSTNKRTHQKRRTPLRSVCAICPTPKPTDAALHSPICHHPDHPAPTDHPQMQGRVQPCTCSPQPDHQSTNKPLNSARQSLHSLHFVTLSFRSVGKRCSAEKNPHRRCSPLRSVCATLPDARTN